MSDHGAVYEFERGERVVLYSRLHPTAVPAVVLRRLARIGAYAVLVNDGAGRPVEQIAGSDEIGLRHEFTALDAIAQERIEATGKESLQVAAKDAEAR